LPSGRPGATFGSSIERQRAERAERVAQQHSQDAERGRALAATLKAYADADAGLGLFFGAGPGGGQAASVADMVLYRPMTPRFLDRNR
jgi:hypothetical protein